METTTPTPPRPQWAVEGGVQLGIKYEQGSGFALTIYRQGDEPLVVTLESFRARRIAEYITDTITAHEEAAG